MADCNICRKAVTATRQNSSISCSDCKKPCHNNCVNMTKVDVECILSQGQVWRCPPCTKSRRGSMSLGTTNSPLGKPDLSQVITMLKEAKDERRKMELEMNKAFDFVHKQIDDQKVILSEQNKQLSDFVNLVEALQEENKLLRDKVKQLEARSDENEQYLRANTVEIHGIPVLPNEDTYEVVTKVGAALDMTISRDMIDICHRLGRREGAVRPAGIIVKFVRREVKQTLLMKRRAKKKDFTTQDVGYEISTGPNIVYINESLSPGRREVYKAAQDAKRNKNYKYLWIRNGRILMRREDNSPVITIATLDDVSAL